MYRKEFVIALFGIAIGISFYAIANLLEKPTDIRAWIGIIAGVIAFYLIWRAIKWIDRDEKRGKRNENAQLLKDITGIFRTEFKETNNLFRELIDEMRQERNERKQSNTDKPTDTAK
jgi:AraC-like DNA-binding protein